MCKDSDDCTMNCATLTGTCRTRSRSVLFPAFDENIFTSNAINSTEKTNGDHIFMINEMLKGVINQCVVETDEETFTKAKGIQSIEKTNIFLFSKSIFGTIISQ